jgi:hypothetical protein
MVLSCLVEPLVSPLTGRDTSGHRRSALTGTRLLSTALACASMIAIAGQAAEEKAAEIENARIAQKIDFEARNAHKKPDPIPYRELLATVFARRDDLLASMKVAEGEAPSFDQKAIDAHAHRLRHKRDIVEGSGPGLGLGRLIDRLYGGTATTFLRFSAGVHRSGVPASV